MLRRGGMSLGRDALWAELSADLRRWFGRRVSNPEQAEDLLQETLLRIHARQDQLRDAERLYGWVYRIARSVLIDHTRRARPSAALPEGLSVPAHGDDDPAAEVASWLPLMILALPEAYREPLWLVELEGLSQAEVAVRLGLSASGARSRVQRGRERLKEMLLACCDIVRDGGEIIDYHPREDCGCARTG